MATTKTELLNNGVVVATKTAAPFYSWDWTPATSGASSLTYKRYEDNVLVFTSAAITGTVEAGVITFPDWTVNSNNWTGFSAALNNYIPQTFDQTVSSFGSATGNFGGVLAANGKIYGAQFGTSGNIKVIDTTNNTTYTIGSGLPQYGYGGGTLAPNGKIYLTPYIATSILVIDPTNDSISTIDLAGIQYRCIGGVLANNGKIYCPPGASGQNKVLVIDPLTDTYTTVATGRFGYYGGVLSSTGHIYFIPFTATSIMKFNPADNTFIDVGTFNSGSKWIGGSVAPNGKIYCPPAAEDGVLIIDPSNDALTYITGLGTSANKWWGSVLGVDGNIYGIPNNSTSILKIDTTNDTTTTFGTKPTGSYTGGVLAPNGKIYALPNSATAVMTIGAGGLTVEDNLVLSRYVNKF